MRRRQTFVAHSTEDLEARFTRRFLLDGGVQIRVLGVVLKPVEL